MKQISRGMSVLALYLISVQPFLHAQSLLKGQETQDNRMVGILSFSSDVFQDSIAAKDVYATVSRILVQTKRFTILEMDKWKLTQAEIVRQQSAPFLDQKIIKKGKSLGARVLVAGYVRNAEIFRAGDGYEARVDYEIKFFDVETGKSIAAQSFKGNSKNLAGDGKKVGADVVRGLVSNIGGGFLKGVSLTNTTYEALTNGQKESIKGKLIDAMEATVPHLNSWIRNTFGLDVLFIRTEEADNKRGKGVPSILIAGGEDIGMKPGCKLKMVLVSEIPTERGTIHDEQPIAELEVTQVRPNTSLCKVTNGGNRVQEGLNSKSMRITFD